MTAPALNSVNAAALPGATAPGAGKVAAGDPVAGFDALLAALFPQADPGLVAPATSAATATATAATPAKGDPLAVAADEDVTADADTAAVATDGLVDPNAALAAALLATPAAAVAPTPTAATPDPAPAARSAGAVRAAFQPILRALPAATPGQDDLGPGTAGDDAAARERASLDGAQAASAAKPAPPAWGRDKLAGQPAAPALANASPKAELAQKFDTAAPDVPTTETAAPPAPAPAETAAPAVAGGLAASLAARPEPVAPAKPAKAERGKANPDDLAASDVKGAARTDTPATARAVTAAAKPAAAQPDAKSPEGEIAPAEAKPDQPDFTPTAETRAASASNAPVQHGAQPVRGSPETVANLSAQIIKKLEGQSTRFDVELDPHGLGKVNVRIDIGAQGAITAAMSFDNPQAAAELRSRATELQRALEQAGFNLSGGVTFDVAQDRGQQQGQAWQDQTDDNSGRAFRGQAFQAALDTAGDAANAAVNGALRLRRGVTAGLDMRI